MNTSVVRGFVEEFLRRKLQAQGRDLPADFSDETDLLLSGMIDSLGILELITALTEFCGREIDFDALDPDKMTIFGPLCHFVSSQCAVPDHSA